MKENLFAPKTIYKETFFWICIVAITAVAALNALIPFATSKILNTALAGEFNASLQWIIVMVVFILALLIFEAFSQYFAVRFRNKMTLTLSEKLTVRLLGLTTQEFQEKKAAHYISVYNNDLQMLEEDYYQKILNVYQGIVGIVMNVGVLFALDRTLMVVVLVASLVPLVTPFISKKSLGMLKKQSADSVKEANQTLNDFINGFHIIKNYQIANLFRQRLSGRLQQANQHKELYEKRSVMTNIVGGLAYYASFVVTIVVGALRISRGLTSVGVVTATIQISDNLIYPINLVSEQSKDLLATRALREELNQLGMPVENAEQGERTVSPMSAGVALQLKGLTYYLGERLLFDDLDFTFKAGEKYLITGASGVGKSTLLKIISGDIRSYQGTVMLAAGADKFRFVYQDAFLFHDDLVNNIALFEGVENNRVAAVGEMTNISHLLATDAADFSSFSGGEQQRISLARGLYPQPALLLLDEATSALDHQNFLEIEKRILQEYDGTLIAISHREDEEIKALYDHVLVIAGNEILVGS